MKSWQLARAALYRGCEKSTNILCTREYQNSIADSVLAVLEGQAKLIGCHHMYEFQNNAVYSLKNNTVFSFKGLKQNINSIKSFEGADVVWNEEAHTTSKKSIQTLYPTIRKPGSEIWTSFNPDQITDPIYVRHVTNFNPETDYLCTVNYTDNPWIDESFLQMAEAEKLADYDSYCHIYLGECWTRSDAQIFNGKWVVEEFEDDIEGMDGPYYGLDFGFAQDPTFTVRCFIKDEVLYISHELSRIGLEIEDTYDAVSTIPGSLESKIRADSARPETISHLKNKGLKVEGVEKWKGSVEDGITVIRSFKKIKIHPRCKNMIQEARLYSYKVDRLTGDVLPVILDKHNHGWDAVRYALAPFIKRKSRGWFDV